MKFRLLLEGFLAGRGWCVYPRRPSGPAVSPQLVLSAVIGILLLSAQPVLAQPGKSGGDGLVVASDRDGELVSRFRATLGSGKRQRDWNEGWQLAEDMGTSALPALRRVWNDETNPVSRFAVLGAMVFASGEGGVDDEFLWSLLEKASGTRERFIALFCLGQIPVRRRASAFGTPTPSSVALLGDPEVYRQRISTLFDLLSKKGTKPLVSVTGCLVARRLGVRPPDRCYTSGDAGIAAAARFAQLDSSERSETRWLTKRPRHHGLVLRSILLGAVGRNRVVEGLRTEALELLKAPLPNAIGLAAAVCAADRWTPDAVLGTSRLVTAEARLPPWTLAVLSASPIHRPRIVGQLARVVGEGSAAPAFVRQRERSAVALALAAPDTELQKLLRALPSGRGRAADVAQAFCLGLALRLAQATGESAAKLRIALGGVADSEWPECSGALWLRQALSPSRAAALRVDAFEDVRLGRAFVALCQGDLAVEDSLRAVEDALWRSGMHPRRTIVEVRVQLLRDLLVSGSEIGRSLYQPGSNPYFARGMDPGDSAFEVVVGMLNFVTEFRAARTPAEHRIR